MNKQTTLEFKPIQQDPKLVYHLLRIGRDDLPGKFWHMNSVFDDYTSNGCPDTDVNCSSLHFHVAHTYEDIIEAIAIAAKDKHKNHFIKAAMDASVYKNIEGYLD